MRTVKWKHIACFAVTRAAVFLCGIIFLIVFSRKALYNTGNRPIWKKQTMEK